MVGNACDKRWGTGDALNALLDLLPGDLAYDLDLIVWLCDSAEEFPGWLYSALKRAQVHLLSHTISLMKTDHISGMTLFISRNFCEYNFCILYLETLTLYPGCKWVDLTSGIYQVGRPLVRRGFVRCFLRVPQAVGLYCSCHAAPANKGNFHKTYYKTFGTSGRPTW